MTTQAERTALVFVAAGALAGGGVRLARAVQQGTKPAPAAKTALEQQRKAVDSAVAMHGAPLNPPAAPQTSRRPKAPRPVQVLKVTAPETTKTVIPARPAAAKLPIDLDIASAVVIEQLPRVGPALAKRIVAVRDSGGPFGSLDSLSKRVKGIGPAMKELLKPMVTFSGH